jgi:hypothetical protein
MFARTEKSPNGERRGYIWGVGEAHTPYIRTFATGGCFFSGLIIAHTINAQAYSRLKQALAQKYSEDIKSYMASKAAFIK